MYDTSNNKVSELRKKHGMTQPELAKVLNVNPVTVARIETGMRSLTLEKAWILADYFNVTLDYIVGRVDYNLIMDKDNG